MRAATFGQTLREIIVHVLEASGLVDFYKHERDGQERLENLEELVNAAESFVTQEGFGRDAVALPIDERGAAAGGIYRGEAGKAEFNQPGAVAVETDERIDVGVPAAADATTGETMSPLAAFLTHASLEAGDNQAQAGEDAVQLMTIHSAKGLEFDCVFISGLEEGLFPHENSSSDLDSLEEERRLMYVAITRARKRLYLSFSQTRMLHGQTRYNVKSRFFDELPESALRWITPRNQSFGSGFAREYQAAWARGSGLHSIVGTGAATARATSAPPPCRSRHMACVPVRASSTPSSAKASSSRSKARRRRARASQLRPPRTEVARARDREADAGRLGLFSQVASLRRAPARASRRSACPSRCTDPSRRAPRSCRCCLRGCRGRVPCRRAIRRAAD
jgi:hypothetical protein